MDSARIGALFFHAVEDLVRANELALTLQLHEPLDPGALKDAYARQVTSRSTLRSSLQLEPVNSGHGWETLDDKALEPLLAQELSAMETAVVPAAEDFQPTNSVLPYRVRLLDPCTLELRFSHLLTNGPGALFWANDLLTVLDGQLPELPPADAARGALSQASLVLRETLVSQAWAAWFLWTSGRRCAERTVDLSAGRPGLPLPGGFARMRRVLSKDASRAMAGWAHEQRRGVTSVLLAALAAEFLAARPDREQVCILMPIDLRTAHPAVQRTDPGNHTGGLPARLKRDARRSLPARLARQADAAWRWVQRGAASGVTRLADWPLKDEQALREQMRAATARPLMGRGAYDSLTCVLSNLGARREHALLTERCEWASITSFGQPPIFSALDVSGRLALELSVSRDLFDVDEMGRLLDGLASRLESGPGISPRPI
jgi:hypothetical protein